MVTITKLRSDYLKVNEKYVRVTDQFLIITAEGSSSDLTETEKRYFLDYCEKIEAGLKI